MEGPFSCNGYNPMFHLDSATHRSFFRILHHIKSGSILGDVFGSGESNGDCNLQEELPNTSKRPAEVATSGELVQVSHSDDVLNSKYALSDVRADLEPAVDVSVEEYQRSPSEILSQNEKIEISKGVGQLSSVGTGPSIRLDLEADKDVHQKQHSPARDLTHVRLVEVPEELRQVDHAVAKSTNRLSYSDVSAGLEQDNTGIYKKQISAGRNACVSAQQRSLGELNQVDSAGHELLSDENTLESFLEEQELGLLELQKELSECIKSKNDVKIICENPSSAKLPEEKDCEDVEMSDNSRQGSHQDESLKHGKQEMGHGHVVLDGNEDSQCQSNMPMESKDETKPGEKLDKAILSKPQSVLPDAEISCLVEKSGDEDLQVNPMGSSGNTQNLDERRITDPVKNSSLDNLVLEEGEILGDVDEAVPSLNREDKDIEFGLQIPTKSSNESFVKKVNNTLPPLKTPPSKVGCTIGQDSTKKIDERSRKSFAVDYSDLYGFDHAPRIGKSIGPLENKNVTGEIKKNKSRMTVATPKDRDRSLKDDGSNLVSLREGIAKGMKRASELEESDLKDVGGGEKKRKMGPPTEERKAKKKLAKKRKRAEQNRKLGIKRLKIQPVSVPKKVTYCSFYLKGRCQQGDSCKFSHDTTPLTKFQPCKYFACQSCLKGDDCPFDHELWKYACHNFTLKGACSRGDSCMFSHKITAVEKPEECAVVNLESLKLSEKPSSEKQTNSTVNSVASLTCPPLAHTNLEQQQSAKTPVKVPRGIRFLSVGRPSLEKANNFESESTLKKFDGAGMQDKQEGVFDKLQKSNEISLRLTGIGASPLGAPGMMAQRQPSLIVSNLMSSTASKVPALGASESSKKSKVGIVDTGSDKASSHGSTASDKTDAIKLLEEFMFGGF